ncbi:MAG TPA: lysophospholipid acyltransferase family protein [Longimicrobium sp.]|nr:lysophospholipid acyltransferase family protein [Longimicrobium sp.]
MDSRWSPPAVRAFEMFFRRWRDARVRTRLAGLPAGLPGDVPLLLAANHVSWWDPFTLREVQRALRPAAPFFTVMLESELARRPFFRRLGVVGLDPASPASLRGCIRQLRRLLDERPDGAVCFFPQGRIWPSFRRPLGFRPGISLLAKELGPMILLPVGLHVEPLNATRPTVFVSAGGAMPVDGRLDPADVEAAVQREVDAVLVFVSRHGEDALRHWPEPRGRLPTARAAAEAGR